VFKHAIVRVPGSNFAQGLTTVDLGVPRFDQVLQQHALYCAALQACGLSLTTLDADTDHPDSTFVEDIAIVTPRGAMVTRPGARSREGEVVAMRPVLREFFPALTQIDERDILASKKRLCLARTERPPAPRYFRLQKSLAHVGGHRDIHHLRVWQIQAGHQGRIFVGSPDLQAGIEELLFADRTDCVALVVVGGEYKSLIWKAQQTLQAFVLRLCAAILEIGSSGAADRGGQCRKAGEPPAGGIRRSAQNRPGIDEVGVRLVLPAEPARRSDGLPRLRDGSHRRCALPTRIGIFPVEHRLGQLS